MHEGTYTMNSGRQQQVHQIIQIATPSASQKIFPNSLGVGLDFFKKKSLITGVSLDNFFLNEGGEYCKGHSPCYHCVVQLFTPRMSLNKTFFSL